MQVVRTFTGAFQANGDGGWQTIGNTEPMTIPENGYLAVYLSNASDFADCSHCTTSEGDVYFDQLQITFTKGHLQEENGYYPFGLPMAAMGGSAMGMTPNRQKYQSNEYITEAGLDWMSFGARQYDPQIGRFLSVDPMSAQGGQEMLSPYQAMGDNPVSGTDPGGDITHEPPPGKPSNDNSARDGDIHLFSPDPMAGLSYDNNTRGDNPIDGMLSFAEDGDGGSMLNWGDSWAEAGEDVTAEVVFGQAAENLFKVIQGFFNGDYGNSSVVVNLTMDEGSADDGDGGANGDQGGDKGNGGSQQNLVPKSGDNSNTGPVGPGMDMENENKNNGSLSQKEKEQQYTKKVAELKSGISFDKEMIKFTTEETTETGSGLELIDRKNGLKGESIKNGEAGAFLGTIINHVIYTYELRRDTETLNKLENSQ